MRVGLLDVVSLTDGPAAAPGVCICICCMLGAWELGEIAPLVSDVGERSGLPYPSIFCLGKKKRGNKKTQKKCKTEEEKTTKDDFSYLFLYNKEVLLHVSIVSSTDQHTEPRRILDTKYQSLHFFYFTKMRKLIKKIQQYPVEQLANSEESSGTSKARTKDSPMNMHSTVCVKTANHSTLFYVLNLFLRSVEYGLKTHKQR